MGSVSSALARSRSRNAVVQLGSSPPPQPEAPPAAPAARGDRFALHKTGRLGPGCGEAATLPAAWESQRIAPSPEGRAKLASPELSPVLNSDESMPQSQLSRSPSAAGETAAMRSPCIKLESSPRSPQLEKSPCSNEDPAQ
ncbi:hypothetical protein MJG53_006452 [Ovis ammon polii x Ovis aries]|uniref:Uncharacterized protein n=1 Tax=Ovis ammon polii x Ovis aries TaxID=2918886 RepID=A0ACB9V5J0_9CETA|nr:hypothetical protein MJG53_006452 [Ovis ammon polii x Ovis aries]